MILYRCIDEENQLTKKFIKWYNTITKNGFPFDLEIFYSKSEDLIVPNRHDHLFFFDKRV
jgi:hypothetical protein